VKNGGLGEPGGDIRRLQDDFYHFTETPRNRIEAPSLVLRLSGMLEHHPAGIILLDDHWRVEYLNREAERFATIDRANWIGRVIWEVFPGWKDAMAYQEMLEAAESRISTRFEFLCGCSGGWFETRVEPVESGLMLQFHKITGDRLAAIARERSERARSLVTRCCEVIESSETEDELLQRICGIFTEGGAFAYAWIGQLGDEGAATIEPLACSGAGEPRMETSEKEWLLAHATSAWLVGRSVREGRWTQIAEGSIEGHQDTQEEDTVERVCFSAIALALTRGEFSMGWLVLDLSEATTLDGEELQCLKEVAHHLTARMFELKQREVAPSAVTPMFQLSELLDRAHHAIWICHLDHTLVYWNSSAEQVFGWAAVDALGSTTRELLGGDAAALSAAAVETVEQGGWYGELSLLRRGGKPLVAEAWWTLLRDEAGRPHAILSMVNDVTDHQARIEPAPNAAAGANRGLLAKEVVHDINNLFTPLMMSIDLLKGHVRSSEGQQVLDMMTSSTKRGAEKVRKLLAITHEGGDAGENVDVGSMARAALKAAEETPRG
jgi:PAS domain S-box-containing protein